MASEVAEAPQEVFSSIDLLVPVEAITEPDVSTSEVSAALPTVALGRPDYINISVLDASAPVPQDLVPETHADVSGSMAGVSSCVGEVPVSASIQHTEGQKKKSRFGLPSFLTAGGHKRKKEPKTGVISL